VISSFIRFMVRLIYGQAQSQFFTDHARPQLAEDLET
jgi:hypothetical protein